MTSRTFHIGQDGTREFTGYLALPPAGRGPGVLLLPEVYGVNADIKALAERYAAAGFVVLAPDLLWRKQANLEFAYSDRDSARAVLEELGGLDSFIEHVPVALEALRRATGYDASSTAVVGFGFGGYLGLQALQRGLIYIDAGVTFFGGAAPTAEIAALIAVPWQFHFGELDPQLPAALARTTAEVLKDRSDAEVLTYPEAGHGFTIAGRKEYHAPSAERALNESIRFLQRHIHDVAA